MSAKNATLTVLPKRPVFMDIIPYKSHLKELLSLSLDRCMQAVSAQSGSIFILDDQKQELVLEVAKNISKSALEGLRTRLGERVSGKVALERKPLLVKDVDKESDLGLYPRFEHYRSKSFLSVPFEFSGDLIGVINLHDKADGHAFNAGDLDTVLVICKYLGVAVHSLLSYLEQQNKLNEEMSKELEDSKKSIDVHKKFSSLGKFVGGFVHEINNPLDGVMRYVNLSLDSLKEGDVSREYLLEAKKGLNRIAQFVRSLYDFSWGLSAKGRKIDINKTVEECLFHFNQHFSSYGIIVEKQLASQLPLMIDHGLKIVFNNVIKNAYEAMKPKGGTLRIVTTQEVGAVGVSFIDTGQGIPSEHREKIFEPFFTTKNIGEGSGLGLALSQEIIAKYEGTVSVNSRVDEGTTITIILPIQG